MKRAVVLTVLSCMVGGTASAQCGNVRYTSRTWSRNCQPTRVIYRSTCMPRVRYATACNTMPRYTNSCAPSCSTPCASACGTSSKTTRSMAARPAQKDIVDTAVGAGSFNTLVAAVKAAGLVDTLKSKGPFTVFAPTDDAFAKLPAGTVENLLKPENKDQLVSILTYHVVSGAVKAADVVKLTAAKTVQGSEVTISTTDGVKVDGANVVKTDIECANGIIHVIDSVILPTAEAPVETAPAPPAAPAGDIVDTAVGAGSFNTLVAAVKAAGLVDTLKGEGPFTVFAPTDAAFAKLPAGTVENLLKPENKDQLIGILTYHVVPGKVMAADVVKVKSAATVNGKEAPITVADGKVKVGNANVVKTDIECSNGVIHVIDAVILP